MNINEFLPPRVAVIEMHGIIGPRVRPHEFARLFKEVRENPRYRAVVLDGRQRLRVGGHLPCR